MAMLLFASCCSFCWLCSVLWLFVIAIGVGDGGGVVMSLLVFVVVGFVVCAR